MAAGEGLHAGRSRETSGHDPASSLGTSQGRVERLQHGYVADARDSCGSQAGVASRSCGEKARGLSIESPTTWQMTRWSRAKNSRVLAGDLRDLVLLRRAQS